MAGSRRRSGKSAEAEGGAARSSPFPLALPDVEDWAALHTHPRAEKVVARFLQSKGVGFYLPMSLHRRSYEGRIRTSWVPLLPGYLFFDARVTDRSLVYGSRRVARVLRPDDPARLLSDLANLARAVEARPTFEPVDVGPPGSPVEVIAGPLQGVRGEFLRRQGASRLVLRVEFLHQAVEVAIERDHVRPLSPQA